MDAQIPKPVRLVDQPFLMPIEDVFSISGRGTVVTGRIERGKVKVGEDIEIVGFGETRKRVVTGVEMFRKILDDGMAGDNVGILLRGTDKDEVERGQVLGIACNRGRRRRLEAEGRCQEHGCCHVVERRGHVSAVGTGHDGWVGFVDA